MKSKQYFNEIIHAYIVPTTDPHRVINSFSSVTYPRNLEIRSFPIEDVSSPLEMRIPRTGVRWVQDFWTWIRLCIFSYTLNISKNFFGAGPDKIKISEAGSIPHSHPHLSQEMSNFQIAVYVTLVNWFVDFNLNRMNMLLIVINDENLFQILLDQMVWFEF
jgi:hypothetical protein